MDDAVARTQGDAAAGGDERRQGAVGLDVDELGIGGGVAEGLHDEIRRETEAGEVFEFVAGHRAGGVLTADGGHFGFAVGAGTDAGLLSFDYGQATGATDHLLGEGVALAAVGRVLRQAEAG